MNEKEKNLRFDRTKCKETSKLKTENSILLKKMFIWSKMCRVVNHSVIMGVVEIQVGNFLDKEIVFRKFRAIVDRATTCNQNVMVKNHRVHRVNCLCCF